MQGAENGIGSTIIVQDGGGAYRVGDAVFSTKFNGCGADFVISVLQVCAPHPQAGPADFRAQVMMSLSRYDARFAVKDALHEFFQEVRRSSEMGLFSLTCNVVKGADGNQEMISRIIEVSYRFYTTEMRLHSDSISAAAIQAIVTSVSRQTRSANPNIQTSTEQDTKLKVRVPVKYIQAIIGYLVVCSNNLVGTENKERFVTLSKVVRCIPSCADAIDAAVKEMNYTTESISYGQKRYVPSSQHAHVIDSTKCRSGSFCPGADAAALFATSQSCHEANAAVVGASSSLPFRWPTLSPSCSGRGCSATSSRR